MKRKINGLFWCNEDFNEIIKSFSSQELKEILKGNSFDKSTRQSFKLRIAFLTIQEFIPLIAIFGVVAGIVDIINKSDN